jgi:RimJ/RimL family protein N-acetyltransferase
MLYFSGETVLETQRLILRHWQPTDWPAFAAMNADLQVMEWFPAPLSSGESDALAQRILDHFQAHGFGLYAVEHKASAIAGSTSPSFIGFIGLLQVKFTAHFTPAVEIGWRLAASHWGQGLATEGARAVLAYAFEVLQFPAIVSFTVPMNGRSQRVMEKIGLRQVEGGEFDHPKLPAGHPLERHALYRLTRAEYLRSQTGPNPFR